VTIITAPPPLPPPLATTTTTTAAAAAHGTNPKVTLITKKQRHAWQERPAIHQYTTTIFLSSHQQPMD